MGTTKLFFLGQLMMLGQGFPTAAPRRLIDDSSTHLDRLGSVYIVLDWTNASSHGHLVDFAKDLIGNISNVSMFSPYHWYIAYSVVLFHNQTGLWPNHTNHTETVDYLLHPNLAANFPNASLENPGRYTGDALDLCYEMIQYHEDISALVVVTHGISSDPLDTYNRAKDLQIDFQDGLVMYSIGLDPPWTRPLPRQNELLDLANDPSRQWNAEPFMLPQRAQELGHWILDDLHDLEAGTAHTAAPTAAPTASTAPGPSSTEVAVLPGEASSGLGAGLVVLIVLLTCCILSTIVGVAYYIYYVRPKGESVVVPEPVVPVAEPKPAPAPVPTPAPPKPLDATQKALQDAIEAKDLLQLRLLLSDILLAGWPEKKYTDVVLKALDAVAQLKKPVSDHLEKELSSGAVSSVDLCGARLCGVDRELLRRAR